METRLRGCALGVIFFVSGCSGNGSEDAADGGDTASTNGDNETKKAVEEEAPVKAEAEDKEDDPAPPEKVEPEEPMPPLLQFSDLCEISQEENGDTTISCEGSDDVLIPAAQAEGCSVVDNGDGTATVTCGESDPIILISDPGYETRITATDVEPTIATFSVDLSATPKALEFHSQCGGEDCEDSDDEIDFVLSVNENVTAEGTAFPWTSRDFVCLGEGAEGIDVEFEISVEDEGWVDLINPAVREVSENICPLPSRLRGHNEDFENGTVGFSINDWESSGSAVEDPDDSENNVLRLASPGSCNEVSVRTLVSVPVATGPISVTFEYKGTRESGGPDDYGRLWARVRDGEEFPNWDAPFRAEDVTSAFAAQRICLDDSYKGRVIDFELLATSVSIGGGSCASGRDIEYFLDNFSVQEDSACAE